MINSEKKSEILLVRFDFFLIYIDNCRVQNRQNWKNNNDEWLEFNMYVQSIFLDA